MLHDTYLSLSMTRPTVFAPRWGEWGMFAGRRKVSPKVKGAEI
jgi:hypothetical protein